MTLQDYPAAFAFVMLKNFAHAPRVLVYYRRVGNYVDYSLDWMLFGHRQLRMFESETQTCERFSSACRYSHRKNSARPGARFFAPVRNFSADARERRTRLKLLQMFFKPCGKRPPIGVSRPLSDRRGLFRTEIGGVASVRVYKAAVKHLYQHAQREFVSVAQIFRAHRAFRLFYAGHISFQPFV